MGRWRCPSWTDAVEFLVSALDPDPQALLFEQSQVAFGTGGVIDGRPEAAAVAIDLLQRRIRQALQRHDLRAQLCGARALAGGCEQLEALATLLIEYQHQTHLAAELVEEIAQQFDRVEA